MDAAIIKLDAAQTALAECRTVMEAKQIADVAEAARVYLERTNASVETVNRAAEIRTLAERQMGNFLKQMPDAKRGPKKLASEPEANSVPTLRDIGITDKQSATAQKLASIPESEFRERVAVAKANGQAPTPAKILTFVKPQNGMRTRAGRAMPTVREITTERSRQIVQAKIQALVRIAAMAQSIAIASQETHYESAFCGMTTDDADDIVRQLSEGIEALRKLKKMIQTKVTHETT